MNFCTIFHYVCNFKIVNNVTKINLECECIIKEELGISWFIGEEGTLL